MVVGGDAATMIELWSNFGAPASGFIWSMGGGSFGGAVAGPDMAEAGETRVQLRSGGGSIHLADNPVVDLKTRLGASNLSRIGV